MKLVARKFLSKKQLRDHIASYIVGWDKGPSPFIWTKPAATSEATAECLNASHMRCTRYSSRSSSQSSLPIRSVVHVSRGEEKPGDHRSGYGVPREAERRSSVGHGQHERHRRCLAVINSRQPSARWCTKDRLDTLLLSKLALFKPLVEMGEPQLELSFARGRGGARPGAGRKKLPVHQRRTPHRARAAHRPAQPVHVTLRAMSRSLRSRFVSQTVLRALRDSNSAQFRIVHYSLQENHLHLIVEASSTAALLSGMRGLMVRVARRVNRVLFRRGQFWADRWHGRALTGPRQVRNTLVYVLQNRLKHRPLLRCDARAGAAAYAQLDPLSSAQWFDGFATPVPSGFRSIGPPCAVPSKTWLLTVGWLRHGRIRIGRRRRADPGRAPTRARPRTS